MRALIRFLFAVLLVMATAAAALAGEVKQEGSGLIGGDSSYLNLSVGTFEGTDDYDDSFMGQAEFRFGKKFCRIGPLAGILANLDGGLFGYAGVYADLRLGHFVLSPQTGFGAYEKGNSKELGGTFQFISALSLSYEFANRSRLGLRYEHISNADLHKINPGADILLLNYGIPL